MFILPHFKPEVGLFLLSFYLIFAFALYALLHFSRLYLSNPDAIPVHFRRQITLSLCHVQFLYEIFETIETIASNMLTYSIL